MKDIGARVYSYLRFSDPRQATGNSADRQLQYAQDWAATKGLYLDDTLSMRDEGLSAYHQKHIKSGALGVFLLAVDEGRIAPGSVLVVEGLDRLSRAEPILAQAQLAQIINAGITVVTASDGREYNRESLKAQPMDLVYSLLVMIRAHEESDTKSKRVKASIRRQCENWQAGTYRGLIRNGKAPHWLRHDGTAWALVPERVEAVLAAIDLFRRGYGAVKIVRELAERGLAITDKGAEAQQIYRLVRLRCLIGEKTLELDGEEYRLAGYYPALMTESEFAELQQLVVDRGRRKGTGEIPGVVTGLGISYCGYCGTAMIGQNLMGRRKEDGTINDGHRRLICVGYSHNTGCPVGGSCSVVPVENAVMRYCSDQMNLTSLMQSGDQVQPIQARLAKARSRGAELEQQLSTITNALLAAGNDAVPLTFLRKARELEAEQKVAKDAVRQAERELAALAGRERPVMAEAWARLVQGVEKLDYDARMQARKLVADTFERIVIYHHGVVPDEARKRTVAVMLVAKAGQTRMLEIDRRTGIFIEGATASTD